MVAKAGTDAAPSSEASAVGELVGMIAKAGPEAKQAMREALGVGPAIQPAKPSQTNADAKRVAYSVGEIQHPEGFQPKPSEAIVAKGPAAVQAWRDQWNARNHNPSNKAEELAGAAVM